MTPGSREAIEQGCTCPIIANEFGEGKKTWRGRKFYKDKNCHLHGEPICGTATWAIIWWALIFVYLLYWGLRL